MNANPEPAASSPSDTDGLTPWVDATPEGGARLLRSLFGFPQLAWKHRDLIRTGVRRDLAARLSGTMLGRAWPLLAPLCIFAVYYFLFTRLLGFRLGDLPEAQRAAFGVYMFLGVVVWSAFADSLSRSTQAFVDSGNLIRKIAFPAELLPVQIALAQLVTMSAALAVFVIATLVTPVWRAPGPLMLLAPVLLVAQVLFTTGLGLAAATLHVFVRDTAHVIGVALTLWMFLTPVFWVPSPQLLPGIEPWLPLVHFNPMHQLLYGWRAILMSGEPAVCFPGELFQPLLAFGLASIVVFAWGYLLYLRCRRRLLDEV